MHIVQISVTHYCKLVEKDIFENHEVLPSSMQVMPSDQTSTRPSYWPSSIARITSGAIQCGVPTNELAGDTNDAEPKSAAISKYITKLHTRSLTSQDPFSPQVNQERIRSMGDCPWLRPVLGVPLSALMLLVWQQEGGLAVKYPSTFRQRFSSKPPHHHNRFTALFPGPPG